MPSNKKQILRFIKFIAELKRNTYPNSKSFAEYLRKIDIEENINIACNARTIQRDIETLKKDFNAPIKFDHEQNGFYLDNKFWEFQCPLLNDDVIITSMLGVRLAEDVVPQPLKSMMHDAVDYQLSGNNSEFLDKAFIESLIIASGTKAAVKPEIFKTVFDGWRKRVALKLKYKRTDGTYSSRLFEPHIIAFHKGIWYTKGIILPDEKERVYAIQRIVDVNLTDGEFEISKKLLDKVHENGLFNYPKLKNVKLLCDSSIAFYLYEHQKTKGLEIEPLENGDLIVTMPPSIEHDLLRWILGEGGKIRVVEPLSLREKILEAGKKIVENNQ